MFRDFQTKKNRLQKRASISKKIYTALKATSTFKLTMF